MNDDDDRTVVTIQLPAPVDVVAAVSQLLGVAWPQAMVRPGGGIGGRGYDILIPRRPKPERVTRKAMAEILAETLAGPDDPEVDLTSLTPDGFKFGVDSKDEAWQRLATWAWIVLHFHEAANYVEQPVTIDDPETGKPRTLLVTACWSEGQTPARLRGKAEAELAAVRAELAEVKAELEACKEAR